MRIGFALYSEAAMDNRAIAIFDSGLGGLTALHELRSLLPGENLIFLGDSANAPYGGRTRAEIEALSLRDLRFLLRFEVKTVLVACGTSSSNAMEKLKESSPVPVVGVIASAARAAAELAPRGSIGVIATEATIRSGAYQRALAQAAPEARVSAIACPAFVPLAESGRFGGGFPETERAVAEALEPFRRAKTDVLLLGCTHYPLLAPEIRAFLPETKLVSNSRAAAHELAQRLREANALAERENGTTELYTSGDTAGFAENAGLFLGSECCGNVRRADMEPYGG